LSSAQASGCSTRPQTAAFRDPHRTLDNFDFTFQPEDESQSGFDLATCAFIGKREDALFSPGWHW